MIDEKRNGKSIWKVPMDVAKANKLCENTLVSNLGIQITNFGTDFLEGTMPIDDRTVQPFRLLHGGASCVLAESLGSIAAHCCLESGYQAVGQHIEAGHLRAVTQGQVLGRAMPIFIGRTSHAWRIEIFNDEGKLVCDSKLIVKIKKK